jgi:hypothetical protein
MAIQDIKIGIDFFFFSTCKSYCRLSTVPCKSGNEWYINCLTFY